MCENISAANKIGHLLFSVISLTFVFFIKTSDERLLKKSFAGVYDSFVKETKHQQGLHLCPIKIKMKMKEND